MAARGLDPEEATPAQLVGALRGVEQEMAAKEGAKALIRIAAAFGLTK